MKVILTTIGISFCFLPMFSQNAGKDSLAQSKTLEEVVVSASNISRIDDHLVIYPNGQQTLGYAHGDYNIAANYVKGRNTYTLFAGENYEHVNNTETWNREQYLFPQSEIDRMTYDKISSRNHQEYMQFRYQSQKGQRYWVGKFTLVNIVTPRNISTGYAQESNLTDFFSNMRKKSLSPKIDLNANLPLGNNQSLTLGVHGKYSANSYNRLYQESPFEARTEEDEKAMSFQLSAIYSYFTKKHSMTIEAYHYHDIWDADYSGNCGLWQHLWKGETLAFFSYNFKPTKKVEKNINKNVNSSLLKVD